MQSQLALVAVHLAAVLIFLVQQVVIQHFQLLYQLVAVVVRETAVQVAMVDLVAVGMELQLRLQGQEIHQQLLQAREITVLSGIRVLVIPMAVVEVVLVQQVEQHKALVHSMVEQAG